MTSNKIDIFKIEKVFTKIHIQKDNQNDTKSQLVSILAPKTPR